MSEPVRRILITGANGRLGQRLIRSLRISDPSLEVRALVRSERAANQLRELPTDSQPQELRVVDYNDADSLGQGAKGCDVAVHLVGIIRESENTTFVQAHEGTCEALASAAQAVGLGHIIYLSIFGANSGSSNPCLASKGRAEDLLLASGTRATILRIPMVLGPGDPSAQALLGQARARRVSLVGGGATLQQPIDCRDVVAAVRSAVVSEGSESRSLDLGGPECLSHADLIRRASRCLDLAAPSILPIPAAAARLGVGLLEKLLRHPPVSLAMFDVLQHNDQINPEPACEELGIALLPLDETLSYCASNEDSPE